MNNERLDELAKKINVPHIMSDEEFRIKRAVEKALKEAGYSKKNDLTDSIVEKVVIGILLVAGISFVLILSALLRSATPWYGYCGYWRRYWW